MKVQIYKSILGHFMSGYSFMASQSVKLFLLLFFFFFILATFSCCWCLLVQINIVPMKINNIWTQFGDLINRPCHILHVSILNCNLSHSLMMHCIVDKITTHTFSPLLVFFLSLLCFLNYQLCDGDQSLEWKHLRKILTMQVCVAWIWRGCYW